MGVVNFCLLFLYALVRHCYCLLYARLMVLYWEYWWTAFDDDGSLTRVLILVYLLYACGVCLLILICMAFCWWRGSLRRQKAPVLRVVAYCWDDYVESFVVHNVFVFVSLTHGIPRRS
jgi:hypothetical protein